MNNVMKIVPDKKYPKMYRIQWPDGSLSSNSVSPKPWEKGGCYGFYNLSRAKEILKRQNIEDYVPGVIYRNPKSGIE